VRRVARRRPALVVLDQRAGLLGIDREALLDGRLLVVDALDQRLAGDVVDARHPWRIEPVVVGATRGDVDARARSSAR
jgi:hypothetical protein